ncbi:phosphotransferase enzyme family-domain-containing protein [Chaetomium strumarium]|uniref:Phosphotransferase enzyme family-domain-containing protein n=1 Tax=Chaetomium strumarium TaxID=1170767 RepID=A0AAJ0M189_9PEZI|nr:phosphotransferase enzyme family-domain-containing protein [Chaetomium strumarium]
MNDQHREGLEWDDSGWDLVPRWAREPRLEAIAELCRRVLELAAGDHCHVAFYAEGAFNKLYLVESRRGKSLLRVSLPVDPRHKTHGECATLHWIREMTTVPVPKVIAFDDCRDNEIGFEWILMELMPGVSAYKRWRKLSMAEKTQVVEQVAEFQSQLFRHGIEDANFQSIGTLRFGDGTSQLGPGNPKPGRLVSRFFFGGDRFNYDVPRGPFRSSHDWLGTQLGIVREEQSRILETAEDEEDRADAKAILRGAEKLAALLPKIFPQLQNNPLERTVLWHDDLSLANILIGEKDAKITAIIDWEGVSCEPLWVAAEMPKFLRGPSREEEPQRDRYGEANEYDQDDELDNEGKTGLYWIHLMEYDMTQLRKVYAAKMRELWPRWEEEVTYSSLKSDLYEALHRLSDGWQVKRVEKWVDLVIEGGEFPRLSDVLARPADEARTIP